MITIIAVSSCVVHKTSFNYLRLTVYVNRDTAHIGMSQIHGVLYTALYVGRRGRVGSSLGELMAYGPLALS
jgi:hypothetical protein